MVTIKKIAQRAGVSIGTVDRVLHGRAGVAPGTRRKILRIVEELGYKPNFFARNLRLARSYVFGVMMPKPAQDGSYWALPLKGIGRAAADLQAQRVEVRHFFFDKFSEASLESAGREVLAARLDGLLLAPVVPGFFERFLRLVPAGLPYVFFDSFVPRTACLSAIGQDAFQSGVLSARLMQMLVKDPGHMAVLRVLPGDYHIDDRVNGFLSFCRKCPHVTTGIVEIGGHGDPGRGRKALEGLLGKRRDLKGVFVTNAATHLAAASLKSCGLGRKVALIGYDLVPENVRYLREGLINFLISQQPERQGYEGITTLYRHVLLKEPVERKIDMQLDIVTSENVDYLRI